LAPGRKDIEPVRAAAWIKRAVDAAAADRIDDAAKLLDQSKRYTNDERELQAARQSIANAWLERAHLAAESLDAEATAAAVAEATAAGAAAETTAPLRARAMMIDAVEMFARDKVADAVTRATEASLTDLSVTKSVLDVPANAALKQAAGARWRARVEAAMSDRDWDGALKTAAAAMVIDAESSKWLGAAISSRPGGLSAIPVEVFKRLPPAALAALPQAALATIPAAALASLPPLRNSIGIDLKLLPAGTFTMGEQGGGSDETPHEVTLTRAFYIGVYEVTNAQWERVMGSLPSHWKEADRPVETVNWEEAIEFCRRLSALPKEEQAGRVYRLPTEAEWEYACRAGSTTRYFFGDNESEFGDYAWFRTNSGDQTHSVGKKKPNAWGLYDMHGNVFEWCNDWYGDYAKSAAAELSTPSMDSRRGCRGGSWYHAAGYGPVREDPSQRYRTLGFRLALSPSAADPESPGAAAGR
jgi:formylglycine-generating enzyme required for sulfatase activity